MKDINSERWTENVLSSMQRNKKVSPSRDLFNDIQRRIDQTEIRVLPFSQSLAGVAAAVLLLAFNFFAVNPYSVFENNPRAIVSDETASAPELISDFKIYE